MVIVNEIVLMPAQIEQGHMWKLVDRVDLIVD